MDGKVLQEENLVNIGFSRLTRYVILFVFGVYACPCFSCILSSWRNTGDFVVVHHLKLLKKNC